MSTDIQIREASPLESTTAMEIATSRSIQEVQGAMMIAKRYPRDETAAVSRIVRACKRIGLAEQAAYSFPRGGKQIRGPSIRLMEMIAANWGNVEAGWVELERGIGESQVMAYCWDYETNTRFPIVFAVTHIREKKSGNVRLTDPRDIYEKVANEASRRVRACIQRVIPGDVIDRAMTECNKTLSGNNTKPLCDRVTEMVIAFSGLGVTEAMIETRLGHKLSATDEAELVSMREIFTSIRDEMSDRFDWFAKPGDVPESKKPATNPTDDAPTDEEMLAGEKADSERKGQLFADAETSAPNYD